MNFQKLSTLAISLIGFYSIFTAILVSGMQFVVLLMSLFQTDGLQMAGFTTLALIPQFAMPLVFGIILIRKSGKIGQWLLSKIEVEEREEIKSMNIEDTSFLLFSVLGLYMISSTFPDGLMLFAAWFSAMAAETSTTGITSDGFWDGRFPEVVYHLSAIGFSCFVFFKGISVSRFVLSLRKNQSNQTSLTTTEAPPPSS